MTHALGEVEALCRKAARGAGFSWGMAEEAGKAVRWICAWDLPGADALAEHLKGTDILRGPRDMASPIWSADTGNLCPITCGAALSDLGERGMDHDMEGVAWPLLMVPHLAWTVPQITLSWGNTHMHWTGSLAISGDVMTPVATKVCLSTAGSGPGTICQRRTRAELSTITLTTLEHFAARTYAPETEASKLTGAGAGLTDKD